jgi:competence protein ComEC
MKEIIKGEIPFVRILIPQIIGISTAYLFLPFPGLFVVSIWFILVSLLLLVYLIIFYKMHYNYHYRWLAGVAVYMCIFLVGYNLTVYKGQLLNTSHFSKAKYEMLVIKVSSEPKLSGDILRFESEVEQGYKQKHFYPLIGKLLIALKVDPAQNFRYGDMLLIPASYNEVEGPYNPSEFNYKAYLADHGIYYQSFIMANKVRSLNRNQGSILIAFAFKLRQQLVLKLNKYISDKNAASVASTLILGYRSDLSSEILDAYSKTGTMHVLSVSGMHVGIVFIVMIFLLKFMDRNKKLRLIRAALIITLIWFYTIVTGFSSAACRAALMLSFVTIGRAIHRQQNTYNLLAISAVLLLIYDPFFLFEVGFQLSYLAVLGLVYLYPKIYRLFIIENSLGDKIWSYVSLSTAAQLATFALSIYYFHQFPLCFLLSNLFILLPVTLIMYAGLIFLFVPWDGLLNPLGWVLNKSIVFTNQGLMYIENLPFSNISGIWINMWTCLLMYGLILFIVFTFIYRHKYLIYISLLTSFILILISSYKEIISYRQNQIIFYSLRKNTGIGFFEGKKAIIISDLKPDEKTFSYSIKPSLESDAIQKQRFLIPGSSLSEATFFSDGNFIQFRNWKLLIWNKDFDKRIFTKKVSVQAVLLQGNPSITVKSLIQSVNFKILLIDASNRDYHIKNWQHQAIENGINYYVLKKNPAYIVKI